MVLVQLSIIGIGFIVASFFYIMSKYIFQSAMWSTGIRKSLLIIASVVVFSAGFPAGYYTSFSMAQSLNSMIGRIQEDISRIPTVPIS